ncbi:HARBI1 family protein [Nonomuraea jabiensis]|uniref:HARBI1 family protein n=1 Tax=Nonomuraea jabiensis TaxID=882448 RepID=UPI003F4E09B3
MLDVRRETVLHLAHLLRQRRRRVGTRKNRRALGCFKQAVMVLRWFLDGTRVKQLSRDNNIGRSTAYRLLHEGVDVLAAQAPDLQTALERAAEAGLTHLNLDGTLIYTDRISTPGPKGADLYWSGKHRHHGGNVQVISAPDGWPIWVSAVRPGREHDLTCARTHGLAEALSRTATETALITLTDLGYEGAREMFRMPFKKPKDGRLTEPQRAFNQLLRGVHGVGEWANTLLMTTFKALRRVSLDPSRITQIAAAAFVLLQLEHGRTV